MKKTAVVFLVLLVLCTAVAGVFADGISVSSENGDRVSVFEDVTVNGSTNGNVIVVLGNVDINADVNGEVIAVFGDATIRGTVSGQVVTVFGSARLTEKAVVQGNLISLGGVEKASGARVGGQEVRIFSELLSTDIGSLLYLRVVLLLAFSLASLFLGLLILMIFRKRFEEIARNIENNFGRKLILGFLAYLGAAILLVLLFITLIAPVLYILLLILGSIASSIYFGRLILKAFNPTRSLFAEFITGLLTVTLVKLLLIYLVPQEDVLLSIALLGLFELFASSYGIGVLMEAKYAKN